MSFRGEQFLWSNNAKKQKNKQLFNAQIDGKSGDDVKKLFLEILDNGVHGFCFSLYAEGQKPGEIISEEQIRRRMKILAPHTEWVRTFSCTEGNELISKVAK